MADKTIDQLTAASALSGSEEIHIKQGANSRKAAFSGVIKTYLDTLYQGVATILTGIVALSATGFISRTGSGTVAARTIEGVTNRITVTNGNGVSGNPSLNVGSDVVLLTGAQTLSGKTMTDPQIDGSITEEVFTITDAAGFVINPRNGGVQQITLTASRTPTVSGWVSGDSITLKVADGTAFTITWTTIGVVWIGGTAPTLATSGWTHIVLWRVGSVYYGKYIGDTAS